MQYPGIGGLAALLLAGYLAGVVYHGNTGKLLNALTLETGFIKWAVALIIFYLIMSRIKGNIGFEIGMLAILGLVLVAGSKIFTNFSTIFKGQ